MTTEDGRTSYDDLESLIFGMDPGDWAAILNQKLSDASAQLKAAITRYADPSREVTDAADATLVADVRQRAALIIATLYQTLGAMPIMQTAPEALDGLHYILASLGDLDRGSAPDWLVGKSTKRHPKRMAAQIDWMSIVTCVQLLRMLPAFRAENAAALRIGELTGRPTGSIKRWCRKLYSPASVEFPEARKHIVTELNTTRAVLERVRVTDRQTLIDRRIRQLLPKR